MQVAYPGTLSFTPSDMCIESLVVRGALEVLCAPLALVPRGRVYIA